MPRQQTDLTITSCHDINPSGNLQIGGLTQYAIELI